MERARAHAMPAGVAIAGGLFALAALSGAQPPVAGASTDAGRLHQPVVLSDEQDHQDPSVSPEVTDDPIVVGDPHDAMHEEDRTPPSDGGHGHDPDADHEEPAASPEDGHGHGQPAPGGSAAPTDDAAPSSEPSAGHDGGGGHDNGAGHDGDDEATGGHDDEGGHDATGGDEPAAAGDDGHGDEGGHGEAVDTSPKPREAVLGGFLVINTLVLAAGAIVRRRDRATAAVKAAAKAARTNGPATSAPGTPKDASR